MAKVRLERKGNLSAVARSDALAEQLDSIADPAWRHLNADPNDYFRSTLRRRRFYTSGRRGRVSVQMGAEATIGMRVQAKRGVFSRALGAAGL